MLEGKIQKDIIAYLKRKKVFHFRFQAQSNLNGVPDVICVYKGLFLGLELKREKGGKASGLQEKKLEAINNAGGIGLVVRSVEEVETLLNLIDMTIHNSLSVKQIRYEMERLYNERDKTLEK